MRTTAVLLAASMVLALAPTARGQVPPVCGNGVLEAPELCDDGNVLDGDCCTSLCTPASLPPDCSAAVASVDELWPPNHKLVPVTIGGVTDPEGDPVAVAVTAIGTDEPVDASGDGATCPDALGVGLDAVSLRSERSGRGDGRVYHVAFQATDVCGGACTGIVTVCVRHDRGRHGACVDGGPLYDATAGVPPCQGDACDPVDCVPDPDEVDACDADAVPAAVAARLDRAERLLGKAGKGKKRGHAAAKQLVKASKRAARAGRQGGLSAGCASALASALESGADCAACSAQ